MSDLCLKGPLNLTGTLKLMTRNGGRVRVNRLEVVVEVQKGQAGKEHCMAPPVPIPPPPASPSDPAPGVWIFKSFNQNITANQRAIVAQGLCAQGKTGSPSWLGMVQASVKNNSMVTINKMLINVVGDTCMILPTGASAHMTQSGQ